MNVLVMVWRRSHW